MKETQPSLSLALVAATIVVFVVVVVGHAVFLVPVPFFPVFLSGPSG